MKAHERGMRLVDMANHMYSGDLQEIITDIITDLLHAYSEDASEDDPAPSEIISDAYESYEYERSFA